MTLAFFLENLQTDRLLYISWVTTLIVSITLHELAHGWAALWQGDPTPRLSGHMTPNPLVHMGGMSLLLLFVVGLAWGMMPVDPSRFRSKYGDALVALAGPAMNVLLAIAALVGLGLWIRWGGYAPDNTIASNWQDFLWVFGLVNVLLAIFNLAPVPPLDGSRILGNFHQGYRRWMYQLTNPWMPFMIYFAAIMVLNRTPFGLWKVSGDVANWMLALARGF